MSGLNLIRDNWNKNQRELTSRCIAICGRKDALCCADCFTPLQVECISDIVINKAGMLKPLLEQALEKSQTVEDVRRHIDVVMREIDKLVQWCYAINPDIDSAGFFVKRDEHSERLEEQTEEEVVEVV